MTTKPKHSKAGSEHTRLIVCLYYSLWLTISLNAFPMIAQIETRSGDLLQLSEDIKAEMPGRDSEGFMKPSAFQMQKWREMMSAIHNAKLVTADSIRTLHFPFYEIYSFTDTGLNNGIYTILQEKAPIQHGWGTYMAKPDFERQICVEIPHPVFDTNTYREGVDIFRRTDASFLLMAGTHRCANAEASPCDGSSSSCGDGLYHVSDMAHFDSTMFQATHSIIQSLQQNIYFINLHGNSRSSCEDIFLSNGHSSKSTSILQSLKTDLLSSGELTVALVGDGSSCSLVGSTNVQGRLTNGSQQPCNQAAAEATQYFIHVEQSRQVRDNFDSYSKLINALNNNIAGNIPVPVELTAFFGISNASTITLHWSVASETNKYGFEIERATNDVNWQRIGFVPGHGTVGAPRNYSFTDNNLHPGLYYYRLKQINTNGDFEYTDAIEVEITLPDQFELLQNFPNPFNPSTTIRFFVPVASTVKLSIYDLKGREVDKIIEGEKTAGFHQIEWHGKNKAGQSSASGLYFLSLETNGIRIIRKVLLIQ